MKAILLILAGIFTLEIAYAQGTLLFDQHSSTNYTGETVGSAPITDQPLGQSFTPAFSSIDFVRLRFSITGSPSDSSANGTVFINLWSGGISNGVLLASSITAVISLSMPNTVVYTNLFFSSSVPLNPGTTYYFQPLAIPLAGRGSAGSFNVGAYGRAYPATYSGGMAFVAGSAFPDEDLWFWEGITVPEPSANKLLLVIMLAVVPFLRRTTAVR